MKKKSALIAVVAALGILVSVGGSMAFFTDTETATNTVTLGNVNITVDEQATEGILKEASKKGQISYAWNEEADGTWTYGNVVPKDTIHKIADILNDGKNSAYVRVKIETTVTNANGEPMSTEGIRYMYRQPDDSYTDRAFSDDDYYYHDKILLDPESAKVAANDKDYFRFLDQVLIPAWGNEYAGATISIKIVAEAIQSDHVDVGNATGAEATKKAFESVTADQIVKYNK